MRTIVCVVAACRGRSAPMNWEAMLAPAWANARMAMKRAPRMGMRAPTPAAAVSEVRDRNQLSIIGWMVPMPKVMNKGHERLSRERSLTCMRPNIRNAPSQRLGDVQNFLYTDVSRDYRVVLTPPQVPYLPIL